MNQLRTLVYGTALTLMIGWVLYIGRDIIVPVVEAALLVYVILGLTRYLGQLPVIGAYLPHRLRAFIAVLLIISSLALVIALIARNVEQVAEALPRYADRLLGYINAVAGRFGVEAEPTWNTLIDEILTRVDLRSLISSTVVSVSEIVAVLAVVLIYAGFMLAERRILSSKLGRLSDDPETVEDMRRVLAEVSNRVETYLAVKTFVNVVLGAVSWVMMTLVGVEFAGFWAVLIGLLNYIPYFGSFLGVLFPVMLSALQFDSWGVVLLVLAVLTAAQMFVGNVLEPYVMGNSLNLSPLVVLLSLAFWWALWGIPGAILSVPVTASLVIVLSAFPGARPIAVLLSLTGDVGHVRRRDGAQ